MRLQVGSVCTSEWSWLCRLLSKSADDRDCRSAMAAFIAWMSCFMTPAQNVGRSR